MSEPNINPPDILANQYLDEAIERAMEPDNMALQNVVFQNRTIMVPRVGPVRLGFDSNMETLYREAMERRTGMMRVQEEPVSIPENKDLLRSNTEADDYIKELCSLFEMDLESVPMGFLFVKFGDYIRSKKEINQILVDYLKGLTENPKVTNLPPRIVDILNSHQLNSSSRAQFHRDLKQARRDFNSHRDSVANSFLHIIELKKAIYRSERNLIKEIESLPSFFTLDSDNSSRDLVAFKTQDCWIRFTRPGDHKKLHLNFGKLFIFADFKSGRVKVDRKENNITYQNYFHPFISQGGTLCFGDQEEMAADFISKGRWSDYFSLLKTLLTTYDPDAYPYIAMETFWYLGKDSEGNHPWRPDSDSVTRQELAQQVNQGMSIGCAECGSDDHETDDCEDMTTCEYCDASYNVNTGHDDCTHEECEDCNDVFRTRNGHHCSTECDDCGNEFGEDGRSGHECPEPLPEEPGDF